MPRWMPRRRAPPASPRTPERRLELDPGIAHVHELLATAPPEDALHGRAPVIASDAAIVHSLLARRWYNLVESTNGRLVGGRVYLREGRVLDLQIQRGLITALVEGTSRYRVKIAVSLLLIDLQDALLETVGMLVGAAPDELQQAILGLNDNVGPIVPPTRHIIPFCTCMDSTPFCKHVCAALHGFGVRLDTQPELLLLLRGLLPEAPPPPPGPLLAPLPPEKQLTGDLGQLFGIDLIPSSEPGAQDPTTRSEHPTDPRQPAPPPDLPEVTREYLRTVGVPTHLIDAWLREGVLRRTHRHGIYERTPEADRRIADLMPGDDGTGSGPATS